MNTETTQTRITVKRDQSWPTRNSTERVNVWVVQTEYAYQTDEGIEWEPVDAWETADVNELPELINTAANTPI